MALRTYDAAGNPVDPEHIADLIEMEWLRELARETTELLRTMDRHAECPGRKECPEVIDRLRAVMLLVSDEYPAPTDRCHACGRKTAPPNGWTYVSRRDVTTELLMFCGTRCLADWACDTAAPDGAPF